MIRSTVGFGLVLVIVSLVPFDGEAQDHVKSFDRLDGPRITLPDDPGGSSEMRQLCPESTETCQRYWALHGLLRP